MPYVLHAKSRASRSTRRPKSRFYKKVSRVLASRVPTHKTNYALASAVGLAVNELTAVGPILFGRPLLINSVGNLAMNVGETNANPGLLIGDGIMGNTIYPKLLKLRGVLRNYIYSPDVTVRMYLVRYPLGGAAPTLSSMYMGLTNCKLIDQFCWTNYTLIAQKDFKLRTAKHTGNYYEQNRPCKPTGTAANDAVGTFWDTPGVSVLGNTNTTYDSENVVYFNANTISGSFAPHCLPFTWDIALSKKVPKVVYEEGVSNTSNMISGDAGVGHTSTVKDYTYQLFTYVYSNALPGAAPVLNSCILDELTIQTFFKNPG